MEGGAEQSVRWSCGGKVGLDHGGSRLIEKFYTETGCHWVLNPPTSFDGENLPRNQIGHF